MDVNDPAPPGYRPAAPGTSQAVDARDRLTQDMMDSLRSTRPWVRFLSIVGFIAVGLMSLGAIVVIGLGLLGGSDEDIPAVMLVGMGLLYLLMAFLYIFPSLHLFRYASSISRALQPGSKTIPVQDALRYQKSFWKFVGILTLVSMLLYVPGVVAAIAIPNFLTATQRSKQKRTMADMRSVATAVEAYAVDNNRYPEGPLESLPQLIEPVYMKTMPRTDGWDRPFFYAGHSCSSGACQEYVIVSGGRNGELEIDLSEGIHHVGPTTNFDDDIAYANGTFIAWPEGTSD